MNISADYILKVEDLYVNRSGQNVLETISFSLYKNECLAITGPSASGKTTLGLVLAKKIFYKGSVNYVDGIDGRIVWVEQQHHFKNLQHTNEMYYQQRFNSYDTEETETVAQSFGKLSDEANKLFDEMNIGYLKDERLIQLSNGENKKLQLLKARLEDPTVLILDQPFIGLDKATRSWLNDQLELLKQKGVIVILISTADEIPDFISKVLLLENGKQGFFGDLSEFRKRIPIQAKKELKKKKDPVFSLYPGIKQRDHYSGPVIEMNDVSVQYGNKIILDNVSWKVMTGERWMLSGPNGAGKSTLLSLVTADNPKAYANSIYLFGKKRGTGESIWDIKKKIGYISPEIHLYFNQSSTCFETVASGLYDTIGLFRQVSDENIELANQWMEYCRITNLKQKRLYELSLGEQRAVLLTRALVKDPPLLILDEPCQGLDTERKEEFLDLINEACMAGNKTMVFVSHYESERPDCITHFISLDKGKVVEAQ